MKLLLCLFLLLSLPAWAWDCTADLAGKNLALVKISGRFELSHPDARHTYAIIPAAEGIRFIYLNSSKNKKNFLRYVVICLEKSNDCSGTFDSSYNGKKTQRTLKSAASSRATGLLDNNRNIFEYNKTKSFINMTVVDSELSLRCVQ